DLQDRFGAAADRGQHLRLLRGDRRADLAEAARSPPDRNAVGRGAGAPREARKGLPRRVGSISGQAVQLAKTSDKAAGLQTIVILDRTDTGFKAGYGALAHAAPQGHGA